MNRRVHRSSIPSFRWTDSPSPPLLQHFALVRSIFGLTANPVDLLGKPACQHTLEPFGDAEGYTARLVKIIFTWAQPKRSSIKRNAKRNLRQEMEKSNE